MKPLKAKQILVLIEQRGIESAERVNFWRSGSEKTGRLSCNLSKTMLDESWESFFVYRDLYWEITGEDKYNEWLKIAPKEDLRSPEYTRLF